MFTRRLVVGALAMFFSFGLTWAQDREWIKRHETVGLDQELVAEYTYIGTHDNVMPDMWRMLYRDEAGALLVIQSQHEYETHEGQISELSSSEISIRLLGTGEEVTFRLNEDRSLTAVIGSHSIDFADEVPVRRSVTNRASKILRSKSSKEFESALRRLAQVGLYYSPRLAVEGAFLRDLFFPDLAEGPRAHFLTHVTEKVRGFDPTVTRPGSFEEPFGYHYYEQ